MATKESAYKKIASLVERFEEQQHFYKKSEYNETQTRRDFIDPFFKALGWDVDNESGQLETYREVIHEDRIKVGKATKAPDYSFKLYGEKRLFFVEAKKPIVKIKEEVQPAYQVRRYGWSAKLAISIITDFEEFSVYDCTKKPKLTDKASVARIKYLTYKDYLKEFDFIWNSFSKEAVLNGSFDKYIQSDTHKKGSTTVDKEFLISLDEWRTQLATSISVNNKNLDEDELNFVVQQTLDRLIFLRIAEDRSVENYGNLKSALEKGDYYQNLFSIFKDADEKYNSGLFDFKKDKISKTISIDNKIIKNVLAELYYPDSPYEFSVLSVEILGSAYEQFLGKTITIDKNHRAKIELKPEVRKAGGVYYTPQYIVEYIVKNTVGKMVEGKTPKEVAKLKIVDPACGSGSFLLGAYQYLMNWHKNYYLPDFAKLSKIAADPKNVNLSTSRNAIKERNKLPLNPNGELTTRLKKEILLNNIYGVDIDVNAVEVTKLSLLLKCMENETQSTITNEMTYGERVLPTLDNNIKSGNSLIDVDFYETQLDFGDEKKIKPFNWEKAFPDVFKERTEKGFVFTPEEGIDEIDGAVNEPMEAYSKKVKGGFDVVIGNPPYVRQELLGIQKDYFQSKYSVFHGMADLYSYFLEKSIKLLNQNGLYGVIVANKWMRANYGEPLRKFLKQQSIYEIIDFGDLPVFESATTYPCIIIAGKTSLKNKDIKLTIPNTLKFSSLSEYIETNSTSIEKKSLNDSSWNLANKEIQLLLSKINSKGIPLGKFVNNRILRGVLTGLNEAFIINEETKNLLFKSDKKCAAVIKPFLGGKNIKRFQSPKSNNYLILFPKGFTNKAGKNPKNAWQWLKENYSSVASHLEQFKQAAEKRFDKGDYWWELRACDYYSEFEKPKIMIPDIALKMQATFDISNHYCANTGYIIPTENKALLGILNSKLVHYFYSNLSSTIRGGYLRFIRQYLETIPIKLNQKSEKEITIIVEQLISFNDELNNTNLSSKKEQILNKIDFLESKLNKLVYQLYDLTEEEIKIVEGV